MVKMSDLLPVHTWGRLKQLAALHMAVHTSQVAHLAFERLQELCIIPAGSMLSCRLLPRKSIS